MAFLLNVLLLSFPINVLGQDTTPQGPTQPGTISSCNRWHTVKAGDSCYTIETDFQISHADFLKYNPAVSSDCVTNFWGGYAYCVGIDSAITSSSSSTSSKPSSSKSTTSSATKTSSSTRITSAANTTYSIRNPSTSVNITTPTIDMTWPPKKTQTGQPSYCNKWYLVEAGDTCNSVYSQFGSSMTRQQLLEWNPALDADCSGLYYGWWICVGVQPRTSLTLTYSASPGNVTGNASIPSYDPFTPIAYPTINSSFTATPTQAGVASDCQAWYSAAPVSPSSLALKLFSVKKNGDCDDTCTKVLAQINYISREDFFAWNPALQGNCDGLWANYWYCVASYSSSSLPMPPTVTQKPSKLSAGTASDCVAWYQMTGSDTCELIAMMFGTFSEADFVKWNPDVWAGCENIKVRSPPSHGYLSGKASREECLWLTILFDCSIQEESWYCVAVPSTPKTRSSLPAKPTAMITAAATTGRASVGARGLGAIAMPTKI
ncbi:MAG: hypothetical protein Q9166_004273 [cf. Caloplaca sp. 2 TL-2023]